MNEIGVLAVLLCIVLTWIRTARQLAAAGKGWLARNFIAGFGALAVGVILAFMLLGDVNGWTLAGWLLVAGVIMAFREPVPGAAATDTVPAIAVGFALSPTAQAIYDASDEPHEDLQRWHDKAERRCPIADIEFDYRNAQGADSHRRVDVEAVDREYFQGHCHKADATRTFVIGRVRGKVLDRETGELLAPKAWAAAARRHPLNDPGSISVGRDDDEDEGFDGIDAEADVGMIEVCFTGFSKADKLRLEGMAHSADMLVRQSVTEGLTHLVAGKNAGPKKLERAEEVGAEVIDEAEFYVLFSGV
ncbi:MAG: hypothetical protein CVU31_02605 [Betaproteobacteria bacterium HGW-Betaproteobacteria-4]|jgi:hypothetical protein|nr:MAG: hypothetical protein CVU31_02605 [Betaproteobacteria bacterium HGW-Betaproteobacteria-4]